MLLSTSLTDPLAFLQRLRETENRTSYEDWYIRCGELEGVNVLVTGYRIGPAFLTQIESEDGSILARGVGRTEQESRLSALEIASERLALLNGFALTVGG